MRDLTKQGAEGASWIPMRISGSPRTAHLSHRPAIKCAECFRDVTVGAGTRDRMLCEYCLVIEAFETTEGQASS
ncbi:hypothetical protein CM00_gp04 [Mycobacterium phage Kugel]|uniref:Uncharacterized protein n=1 Tax=Mycobacterium phage Kugel TaxID=2923003 RepID=G8IB42_9CAUD|nr:hypothetical protein CM00_gp04 [Mycobacterium phage Kugel]AER49936.1 hypothetical protein KUGEL_4 [Mycobacterium phage Kugel]